MKCCYCTHCGSVLRDKSGAPCGELYDQELHSKSGILKLMACTACSADVADKYVEVDGALLLIDLALQSKQAYRHVLLNRTAAWMVVAKMTLLTVICDGYIAWAAAHGHEAEFFEQEYEFYITCSKAVIALMGFLTTAVAVNLLAGRPFRLKTLIFGLMLAYSSRFFNLMSLLWSSGPWQHTTSSSPETMATSSLTVMTTFVHFLFFISSVRVHQVAQSPGRRSAGFSNWIQMAVCHAVFVCLFNLDQIILSIQHWPLCKDNPLNI